jgi:DNA-binding ferritin-like protein
MISVVTQLIKLQEQIRILHWQTKVFSRHKAYGKAYDDLGELIDELVEVYQGKNGRLIFQQHTIDIQDLDNIKITELIDSTIEVLTVQLTSLADPIKDTDILNIRDSIIGSLNRFKYILTLK